VIDLQIGAFSELNKAYNYFSLPLVKPKTLIINQSTTAKAVVKLGD
jgi:hypothetical protein